MKKNVLLYVLLFFLIIVNGFFLYIYLGKYDSKNEKRPVDPMNFVIQQLNFDESQLQQLTSINKEHLNNMMSLGDETKQLKDDLFNRLSDATVNEKIVDSITNLIGLKEKEKDTEAFYHFRSIQELCNDKQKEKFKKIINDALRKGGDNRPPPPEGDNRNGPPPPPIEGVHDGPPPM